MQISLLFGFTEEVILTSASAFSLLQYVVFVEVYEENWLHMNMLLEKDRSFFQPFQIIVDTLCYYTKTQQVLVAVWNRKPYQQTSVIFSYISIYWSRLHFEWVF